MHARIITIYSLSIVRFKSDYVCRDWTAVYAAANMYLK